MTQAQGTLHDELRTEIRRLHGELAALVRPLDPERLVRRPGPGAWSVAEVLEHLCLADEEYAGPIAALLAGGQRDAGAGRGSGARAWSAG